MTIFMTTHDMDVANEMCDRIAIINKGKLIGLDTPENLKKLKQKHQAIDFYFSQDINESELSKLNSIKKVQKIRDYYHIIVNDINDGAYDIIEYTKSKGIKIKRKEIFEKYSKSDRFFVQIKRSFAITKKDLKIYYNKGPVVIQGIFLPIMLFFAFTIGRNIMPIYILSGLMAMVLFMTSTSIGPVVFPWETRAKTLERLIACPISIKTILLGNIWSSFIFGFIFSFVPLILGIIFFGIWYSINIFIIILGIMLASLAFSSFSLILSVPPTETPANTMILTILIKFV